MRDIFRGKNDIESKWGNSTPYFSLPLPESERKDSDLLVYPGVPQARIIIKKGVGIRIFLHTQWPNQRISELPDIFLWEGSCFTIGYMSIKKIKRRQEARITSPPNISSSPFAYSTCKFYEFLMSRDAAAQRHDSGQHRATQGEQKKKGGKYF